MTLVVDRIGPGASIQDFGRPGWVERGLSESGALDPVALHEGAAILGHDPGAAALEMIGMGGSFTAKAPVSIALTGAGMPCAVDGAPIAAYAGHPLEPGQVLEVGAARDGVAGYLHLGGGIAAEPVMGSRAAHLRAGVGRALKAGDEIEAVGGGRAGRGLAAADRFGGGVVRVIETMQSTLWDDGERRRFSETVFRKHARSDRMAARIDPGGAGFALDGGLSVISEIALPGDIQITGDGTPFVLLPECQTTGGYPRIGAVIPADLPLVAQAPAGAELRFRWVSLEEAVSAERAHREALAALPSKTGPLVRDPADAGNLLAHNLVGGVVSADDGGGE